MKTYFSLLNELNKNTQILNTLEECITVTLGPKGKNGIVSDKQDPLKFISNGSLLLKSLNFPTSSENIILKLLEQAATKTFSISGDGSTLTNLLSCSLLKNCLPFLISGYNPIFLSNGLKKISYYISEKVVEFSTPISTTNQLLGIIRTSLGKKINSSIYNVLNQTVEQISRDGLILIEENILSENQLEIVQGIELDKGFASSYFVNDLTNFEVMYENPSILITTNPINTLNQISKIIEYIKETNKSLVIVAEEINKDLLSTLILNNIKKTLKIVVIKYSSIKFIKTGILEDLALLTHSNYHESELKDNNYVFTLEDLGKVKKVIIGKDKSTFIVSKFSKLLINRRINELNRELLLSESEYEKNLFKMRIARLSGNILKIKLGSSNQYEFSEIRQKVENTITTLRSTLEEGFLPGGSCFFTTLSNEVLNWGTMNLVGEEIFAAQIVSDALLKPQKELLRNILFQPKVQLQLYTLGYPYSYNLLDEKIVNTLETNLIDSTKAIRGSLWNSITMISTLITS